MERRLDYSIIADLINPDSRVLDLGCGNGDLLSLLEKKKNVRGAGIEINEKEVDSCIEKGLTVIHGDIDTELLDYSSKRFDYVILYESLQQVLNPKEVILESLRVSKKVIVGIPNFCHANGRFQVFFKGNVPITKELPDQWYNTPNLRFLSIKDFQSFCVQNKIKIEQKRAISRNQEITFWPNLFAHVGIFVLSKN